ncbi:MAG TPA: co-chaperone GroES [bacterium]
MIRPLNKRIAVRRFSPKDTTAGGLILPEQAKEIPVGGEVKAVGNGIDDIAVGDVVIFGKNAGQEIAVEGEAFLMLRYEDVLGIYEK